MPPGKRQCEGRALEPLLEPRREQADDARRPRLSRHDDRSAPFLEAQRQQRFGLSLRQRFDLDLLTDAVQPVEFGRDRTRLEIVGCGQEPDAERRVADASARVDARTDDKAQVVGPRRSVGAGDVEQGRKPRPAALTHDREALDDKGAVEPDQRHDVGDGRERNEVERRHKVRTSPAVPEARLAQRAVERHERHEDDAGGAEIAQARKIVLTVGIDQRGRSRQHLRGLMVIEHDHIEAEPARDLERLAADRAAVDGHNERRALRRETLNRLDVWAIALGHAVGDMDDRLQSAGGQIFAEERRAACAVDVVVAEDRHPLMGHDRPLEAVGRGLHVAEAKGVRHQIAEARSEMALNRLRQDAAPREHAGDQFVVPANLRNGERAQFPRCVKPRPPRPAERRGLDVEEIMGGRQDAAFGPVMSAIRESIRRGAQNARRRPDAEGVEPFEQRRESVLPKLLASARAGADMKARHQCRGLAARAAAD